MPATDSLDFVDLLTAAQQQNDAASKAALVKRYLHLVHPIAQRFAHRPDLVDDFVQVGSIGLLRAIERFDLSLGKSFESYANSLIAGEIRHYMRDAVPLVRPPRELVELRGRVMAAQASLLADGLEANEQAIANLTGIPLQKVEEVFTLEHTGAPASIDQEMEAEQGSFRFQLVDNHYKSFQLSTEDQIVLNQALSKLRGVSREVIEFAFYEDLTQTEIAKKLGISQMQVSRRLKTALGELWKVFNTKLF